MIPHPERSEIQLESVLHALSDPVRLCIVRELAEDVGERRCGSFEFPVTKSTMTHHFKVLREAGLIRQRQEATLRLTSLRRDDLDARFPGLLERVLEAARQGARAA
jgi:DNA-binding transcriptional ArsR family regulator